MPISNGSLEDEDCSVITDWTDLDKGVAESYQVGNYFCFLTNASAIPNDYAHRKKDSGSANGLGNRIVVSLLVRLVAIGTLANLDYFQIGISRSDWRFRVNFASDGLFMQSASGYNEVGTNLVQVDTWQKWTFDIDLSSGIASTICDVYLDDVLQASNVSCNKTGTYVDGESKLYLYGYTTDDRITYLDYYKIGNGFVWEGKLNGITNPAKIMGISVANISKVMGI